MPLRLQALVQVHLFNRRLALTAKVDLDEFFESLTRVHVFERGDLLLQLSVIIDRVVFRLARTHFKHAFEVLLHPYFVAALRVVALTQLEHLFSLPSIPILVATAVKD